MRLTNEIREDIISTVRAKTINKRHDKLKVKLQSLAQAAADKYYPPKVKEWVAAMPKTDIPLLHTVSSVEIEGFTDPIRVLDIERAGGRVYKPNSTKCSLKKPFRAGDGTQYGVGIKLGKCGDALQAEYDQLRADLVILYSTLKQALYGCTTLKQLHDNYPDLAKHVQKPEPKTKAIAITSDSVRDVLKCAADGGCK